MSRKRALKAIDEFKRLSTSVILGESREILIFNPMDRS